MEQKVVLITAGTGDIAKECINRFTKEGYVVCYTYRSNKLEEGDGYYYDASTDYESVIHIINSITQKYGRLDILVNNLGKTNDKLIARMDTSDFIDVMNINLVTCFNFSKAALKFMSKKKSGKIVNISSVVGVTGNVGQANYSASKAAMYAMTKSMAKEYGRKNICINCISPGFIKTKMTDVLSQEIKDSVEKSVMLNRFGTCQEVANLVYFLGSEESDYITGQNFVIDGGLF